MKLRRSILTNLHPAQMQRHVKPRLAISPQVFRGFTLIELLVVIAIISLLVSILMPSLNKAKDLARQVTCSANIKNINLGFNLYINDWEGYFPLVRETTAPTGTWADKLYNDYIKDVNVFMCPSVPERTFTPNVSQGARPMAYGMEWWLGGGANITTSGWKGRRLIDIANPSITVLLGENNNSSTYHGYGLHNYLWPDNIIYQWGWPDDERHSGVSNILFVDGRIAPYTREEACGDLFWYTQDNL